MVGRTFVDALYVEFREKAEREASTTALVGCARRRRQLVPREKRMPVDPLVLVRRNLAFLEKAHTSSETFGISAAPVSQQGKLVEQAIIIDPFFDE